MYFFFNDTATTEIYTLSLHDALPILSTKRAAMASTSHCSVSTSGYSALTREKTSSQSTELYCWALLLVTLVTFLRSRVRASSRSEEHTSELQSRQYLVCRLLLEKINI